MLESYKKIVSSYRPAELNSRSLKKIDSKLERCEHVYK